MKRSASAVWTGGLKEGQGTFGVASGAIKDQKFGFRTRFEDAPGTNPEELIAAAHASCFSMALSAQLGERGIIPEAIETTSTITFENLTLSKSALKTTVKARGADKAKVEEAAAAAKAGCPISKVLNSRDCPRVDCHGVGRCSPTDAGELSRRQPKSDTGRLLANTWFGRLVLAKRVADKGKQGRSAESAIEAASGTRTCEFEDGFTRGA